ncbi:hybrid sensor histidine kinase/response regulator transcription factor [Carboxylicivirga sp. M1479]|uniref:hybrid sensor histidine kinase/response regulator transcription factor n=1 Tax=Carboxylicivirga sp. M1479 TaxID=2594476 RepID=UPI00163D6982|nr:hybrid sensor histidine kinase/response regulator transcription factor [Carboxylicivirga sp. M1479]
MMIKKRWLIWCLIISVCGLVSAQNVAFEYLGLKDGISQVSVTSLMQDESGRIWIGTRDGLNVYDGNRVKTFRPVQGDKTSILGHNIRALKLDGKYIWAATNNGVSRLNTKTLEFEQFPFDGALSLLPYKGRLLLGTSRGLFELNPDNKAFVLKGDVFANNCAIRALKTDNAGMLWICSDVGLYKYNANSQVTTEIWSEKVNTVYTDSQKRIWVGTEHEGVVLLNRQHDVIKHFKNDNHPNSLVNNIIRAIGEDSKGNIWVGTFLGLSIIDGRSLELENYQQSDEQHDALSHNSVYSILHDQQGTMWVGTYFGGISYYNPDFHVYRHFSARPNHPQGVNYHVVGKMLEDGDNNLWIGTEGGGLDYLDRDKNLFKHYLRIEGKQGLSHNNVKSLCMIENEHLLIGMHLGGLNRLDIKTGKFINYVHNPEDSTSLPSNVVNSIIPYDNYYLLGTHDGIVKYDAVEQTFEPFITDKEANALIGDVIFCLFEDSFGKLWIGTERNGLCVYDAKTKKLKRYVNNGEPNSLSANTINCIFEDHQFRLWVGTLGGGLNQYIRAEDHFVNYSRLSNQLPSDFVYGIQESRYGNLWVATSKGLVRFEIEKNRFYSYESSNGFPIEELNDGSLYLTSDGEVFVGGINGLVSFKEEDLLKKSSDFSVLFTSLYVNNKEVKPNDETRILKHDLVFTDRIELEPEQDVFTIDYAACNYISTNQSRYEYQLENFNKDWVKADNQTSVTYTNLDPGTYTLKVRVLNSVDDSVVDSKSLEIIVNPPYYQTWYAYVFYVLVMIGIILWLNQIYLSRVRLEDSLKGEKREKEQIKEMNQSKLRFFTNISHEFRTPLTLITGTLEAILEDTKTSARNYKKLLTINNNAVRLNNLITELLDFRKMEQGYLKLKVSEYKVAGFLDEIFQSFVEYAHYHQVEYDFKTPPPSLALWFDGQQMEKVFYNLISNAFKVVDELKGKVIVEVIEQPAFIDVVISDNGPGMPPEGVDKIFDRFYQIDKVSGKTSGQGSGIGLSLCKGIIKEHQGEVLVDSAEGEGTSFTVRLKKGNKHYTEDELVLEKPQLVIEQPQVLDTKMLEEDEELPGAAENAPKLLLVEDNTEARALLHDIFASRYKVIEAEDGSVGLNKALEEEPDLIISDVMMPNMSGTQMCAKLKRNVQTCHIPIVLLTARTAMEYKIEGVETGADDYITKPFNVKLLRARVKNLLQNRTIVKQKFKQDPKAEVKELAHNSIDQKLLEKAQSIIEEHIDDTEFDVNDFAKALSLGRTRLYSKIKGITGQTPNDFILSIRLKKSAELLLSNPEMNVSEIAYAVGFGTPRYFSRCFREHFGVTPSKYTASNSSGAENADFTESADPSEEDV